MKTRLRAAVFAFREIGPGNWITRAGEVDSRGRWISPDLALVTTHRSWPEAMQDAYRLLNELDAELMAEVHASRAARRDTRQSLDCICRHPKQDHFTDLPTECANEECPCTNFAQIDMYTMEPTE